jgi:Flp pilus assembly protein TadD
MLQVALRMEQQGRFEDAIGFLERSIAQSPDAASLYNRLGIIVMRERVDYARAEELMRKAVELAPGNRVYETNLQMVVSQQELPRRS